MNEDSGLIKLMNLKEGDIIEYPLIILHGTIKKTEMECCKNAEEITIKSKHYNCITKIYNNSFKTLIELKLEKNIIEIKHCCHSTNLTLYHRPRQTNFMILPLYIICEGHDGTFQGRDREKNSPESAITKIELGCKLIQTAIGEKLHEMNLGRKSFNVATPTVFHSKLNFEDARQMKQEKLWETLGREIVNSIGDQRRKYLGFLSCSLYRGHEYGETTVRTHEDVINLTEGYVALGGGALALFHTCCLYSWPNNVGEVIAKFEDHETIERTKLMDCSHITSINDGTFGSCFATSLGSVLHELCHAFDLGHTQQGIMGHDYGIIHQVFRNCHQSVPRSRFCHQLMDGTFWTRSSALLLAYSKWFNKDSSGNCKFILSYDPRNQFIRSTLGLKAVEIRDLSGLVLQNWSFEGRILKYSFQLIQPPSCGDDNMLIVAVDNSGNILKHNVIPTKFSRLGR